jgi:hypothetical protein
MTVLKVKGESGGAKLALFLFKERNEIQRRSLGWAVQDKGGEEQLGFVGVYGMLWLTSLSWKDSGSIIIQSEGIRSTGRFALVLVME